MLSSFKNMPPRRRKVIRLAGLLLIAVLLPRVVTGGTACLMPGQLNAYRCIVNRNVGYGHMTRGMNMYTIEALDKATTVYDLPALKELLKDDDRITAMTAAEVMKRKGEAGTAALKEAFDTAQTAGDKSRAALIEEYGELHRQE